MPNRPDFLIYAPQGHLRAVVEVKGGRGKTAEWAALFRRNIMEIGDTPPAEFYLFVMADRIWVWKDVPPVPKLVMPTLEVDAAPIFAPYYKAFNRSPERTDYYLVETMASIWLENLSDPYRALPDAVRPLQDIGFVEALRNARIVVPEAA